MDAGFDFGFQGSALAFVQGRGRTVAFDRYLESREQGAQRATTCRTSCPRTTCPARCYQLQGDVKRFRLAAVLQLTTAGIPIIYYGEEVGRPGGDWPDNRSDMPWGERDDAARRGRSRATRPCATFYKKLIAIRRAAPGAVARHAHGRSPRTATCSSSSRTSASRRRGRGGGEPRREAGDGVAPLARGVGRRGRRTDLLTGAGEAAPRWTLTVEPLSEPASWRADEWTEVTAMSPSSSRRRGI